jgi:hypothetical protein
VIRGAIILAQTPQGRKMIAQAQKAATNPDNHKRLAYAVKNATAKAGKATARPENRERLKQAAQNLRNRGR